MINKKNIIGIITIFFALLLLPKIVNAADITYKTECYSQMETAIYVDGLEQDIEDGYSYYIYVTQDSSVETDTVINEANMAGCDSLKYDEENDQFYLNVSAHNKGIFEKTGDYYAFIVKGKVASKDTFTVIDGPTKLERPELLPNGERITADTIRDNGFSYHISQYGYYTKLFGTDRKIKFHLGKLDDEEVLKKFANNSSDAYDALYNFAKNSSDYLYSGSFDTTSTGVTDYNLWDDYDGIKVGELYFVYFQLDDEDGKYIEVDDVQPYICKSEGFLQKLSASDITIPSQSPEPSESQETPTKIETKDETVSNEKLPYTGINICIISIIALAGIAGIIAFIKCRKVKDVK